ncbi:APH domain-containing protein, partial [Haematococcus lacustris]
MSRTVHAVRCLRWLPGKLMAQVPQVPSVHSSLGRLMGRVSSTLALGPALPALNRQHAWHCHTSLPTVQRLMPQVQGLSPGQA